MIRKILLIGHRRQLVDVFIEHGYSFFIWNEKPILDDRVKATDQYISTFSDNEPEVLQKLAHISNRESSFTHVIAGKEMAVIATSIAQKFFQCSVFRSQSQANLFRDKVVMKEYLAKYKIEMTPFYADYPADYSFKIPLVLKERNSTGSRGIEVLTSVPDLVQFDSSLYYFEEFIDGTEGSVESFIQNGKVIFTSITEYLRKKFINLVGAHYASLLEAKILDLNQRVLSALKLENGMTHLEFYLTPQGHLIFGEIALRPPGGHIMELIEKSYGFNPWRTYVDVELGNIVELNKKLSTPSIAYIFHPGQGVVKSLPKKEEIKKIAGVYRCKIKIKLGQRLLQRNGVGEEAGYVLATSPLENVTQLITQLDGLTKIELAN